jgi:hypothetical protein
MKITATNREKRYKAGGNPLAMDLRTLRYPFVAITRLRVCALLVLLASTAALGQLAAGDKNREYQSPPIKLGTSGGPESCARGKPATATLGSLVIVPNPLRPGETRRAALSNAHILSCDNSTVGTIIQPGSDDLVKDKNPEKVALTGVTNPIDYKKDNLVDAAIAYENQVTCGAPFLGTPCFDDNGAILEIGTVSNQTAKPAKEMKVQKSGRSTGKTEGKIEDPDANVTVSFGPNKEAKFVHQMLINKEFCEAGDSGSLVVAPQDKGRPKPVGLLFSKAERSGLCAANPIDKVLEVFKAKLQTAGAENDEPDLTPEPVLDWQWEAARLVRDRYDDFLSRLPEVVGEGVSLSRDGSGEVVILLYVRQASDEVLSAIPEQIEGIRVETEETGEFVPL